MMAEQASQQTVARRDRRRWNGGDLLTALVLVALTVVCLVMAIQLSRPAPVETSSQGEPPRARQVESWRVDRRELQLRVVRTGRAAPAEQAVAAPAVASRVTAVHVVEGELVEAGQELVELDSSLLRLQLDEAAAGLRQAQVQSGEDSVAARLAAAREQQARLAWEQRSVRSPVAGRVLKVTAVVGQGAAAGVPLVVVLPNDRVALRLSLTPAEAAWCESASIRARPLGAGEFLPARLRAVAPIVEPRLGRAEVDIEFIPGSADTPAPPRLRPGEPVEVELSGTSAGPLVAPLELLRPTADGLMTLVLTPRDGTWIVEERRLATSEIPGAPEWRQIDAGLEEGTLLVRRPLVGIVPGMTVETDDSATRD